MIISFTAKMVSPGSSRRTPCTTIVSGYLIDPHRLTGSRGAAEIPPGALGPTLMPAAAGSTSRAPSIIGTSLAAVAADWLSYRVVSVNPPACQPSHKNRPIEDVI